MKSNINTSNYIEFEEDKEAKAWGNKYYSEWAKKYINDMKMAKRIIKESIIQEKGFISTSLLFDIVKTDEAYSNYSNMLKIYVQANTIGIYVNNFAERREYEMLLFPGGYFKLIKDPYVKSDKKIFECELIYL